MYRPPVPTKRLNPERVRTSPVPTVSLSTMRLPESCVVSGLEPIWTVPMLVPTSSSYERSPSKVTRDPSVDLVNVAPAAMRVLPATFRVLVPCTNVPNTVRVPLISTAELPAVKVADGCTVIPEPLTVIVSPGLKLVLFQMNNVLSVGTVN